jgi:RNA polymerase sigma-70 factor (ECF subfamily)
VSELTQKTDEELIELANKGYAEGFEGIYYRYRDWTYRLAFRFTGEHESALDVLQETFIYLLGKFPGFKLTAKMTTFLYPVVRHLSILTVRRTRSSVCIDDMPDVFSTSAEQELSEQQRDLAEVFKALPEKQRETVLMRFVDGMELKEIATALGIPLGTVKSRLGNALRTLRQNPGTKTYFLE